MSIEITVALVGAVSSMIAGSVSRYLKGKEIYHIQKKRQEAEKIWETLNLKDETASQNKDRYALLVGVEDYRENIIEELKDSILSRLVSEGHITESELHSKMSYSQIWCFRKFHLSDVPAGFGLV